MTIHRLDLAATGRFSALALDHANADPFLTAFREFAPDRGGLRAAAQSRAFAPEHRAVLVSALRKQYAGIDTDGAVDRALERLADERCLTVTTGHQLCLFTGPLYFPLKIMNVIRLAAELEEELKRPVVPVFWMATEDHDRPEVDHAWFGEAHLRWPGESSGPVGRMPLQGISAVLREACDRLGEGEQAERMKSLLRDSYTEGRTLAEATRRFVHALFGRFGLIALDGDDRALKELFVPVMREELLHAITERTVRYADERLAERYKVQAHARPVNLFHLRPGHRARIERIAQGFGVLEGGPVFSAEELLLDLEVRPQDYSPNVLLRPVYQETVLPNIAYVGGGGELAYWMQLKWLFQAVQVPMPVVLLRTSMATLTAKDLRQWTALGLSIDELFRPSHEILDAVASRASGTDTDIAPELDRLNAVFGQLGARAAAIDPSLGSSAAAAAARATRALEGVGERMRRALRRKEQVQLRRAERVLDTLLPGGGLQERKACIVPMLAQQGEGLIDRWIAALDPLDPRFSLLVED